MTLLKGGAWSEDIFLFSSVHKNYKKVYITIANEESTQGSKGPFRGLKDKVSKKKTQQHNKQC
jgi:hypothetical protein